MLRKTVHNIQEWKGYDPVCTYELKQINESQCISKIEQGFGSLFISYISQG